MKKKVLIIPSWYPNRENPLIGSFFQEQALKMHNNGFDIKILLGKEFTSDRIDFVKYKLKNIISPQKSILKNDYLIQEPEAFSFNIIHQINSSDKNKIKKVYNYYVRAVSELVNNDWKPDLIHAQCTVDAGIIANYLSNYFNIPFVIIEHQVFLLNNYSVGKQLLIRNALQTASKVGAVSNHQKRCILMNSIYCDPIIIWNLVDENKFKIERSNSNLKFRIITITYPNFIKDAETFFKSIKSFREVFDGDFDVVVVGGNSFGNLNTAESTVFEGLAKKYNVLSYCKLIPQLSRQEISQFLNTADVFVSTSIAETFGVAIREAMLCGIPVVATKSGGVEDSINEKTGILVNIGDFAEIAISLLKIKNNDLNFDSEYIRNFATLQCGTKSFLNQMVSFYS